MKTRNVGKNKGIARIWLEAGELSQHGIKHGMRFNTVYMPGRIHIDIDPQGKKKIAGSAGREIIDMTGKKLIESGFIIGAVFTVNKTRKGIELLLV